MTLHPATRTRLRPPEAIAAFSDAHLRVFGIVPSDVLLWVLASWSAFETDAWRAMFGNNMSNMRGSWHGQSTTFKASEVIDGKEVFLAPSASNLFRCYPTAVDGAEDTIRFVGTASDPAKRPNRYERAWNAALVGDFETFVDGLAHPTLPGIKKVPGFFTANPRVYLAGVRRHAGDLRAYFPGLPGDIGEAQVDTDPSELLTNHIEETEGYPA